MRWREKKTYRKTGRDRERDRQTDNEKDRQKEKNGLIVTNKVRNSGQEWKDIMNK